MTETISIPSSRVGAPLTLECFRATGRARPLVVVLRAWPGSFPDDADEYVRRCEERGWHCLLPGVRESSFRADGPDCAFADVQDAYNWAMGNLGVDPRRIFLAGQGAGGYMALLAVGNLPSLWTAVSVWSPVFDLDRWYEECAFRGLSFAKELEAVCGGAPGSSPDVDARYLAWSPAESLWRAHIVPVDINAGTDDSSIPAGHAIRAFNELVKAAGTAKGAIPEDVIEYFEVARRFPDGFERRMTDDPSYSRKIHLRRVSALSRLTVSEGGGEMLHDAAFAWFERF